jgi:hypothetical protein
VVRCEQQAMGGRRLRPASRLASAVSPVRR